jgi:hypothetical protein
VPAFTRFFASSTGQVGDELSSSRYPKDFGILFPIESVMNSLFYLLGLTSMLSVGAAGQRSYRRNAMPGGI